MRVLSAVLILLLSSPALAGTKYFVRGNDGNDNCDGTTDAGGSSGACAFATVQKAFDTIVCTSGDDIDIRNATAFYVASTLPNCRGTSGDHVIVQTHQDDIGTRRSKLVATGADTAGLKLTGGATAGTRDRFIDIKDLEIEAGDCAAIWTDQEVEDLLFENVLLTDTTDIHRDGAGCTCTNFDENGCANSTCPGGTGHRVAMVTVNIGDRVDFKDSTITGDNEVTCSGKQGARAGNMFFNSTGTISGNTFTGMLGGIVNEIGNSGGTIIENNIFKDANCVNDDGCVQVYNDGGLGTVVRRNVFDNICPDDFAGTINTRGTSPGNSKGIYYNNTFIIASGCTTNANQALRNDFDTDLNNTFIAINNIFKGADGGNGFGRVTAAAGTIQLDSSSCPDNELRVQNNLYFQNDRDFNNSGSCTCDNAGGCDANAQTGDPVLNATTYLPEAGSAACDNGFTGYTAHDGDTTDAWIGAKQGVCGATAPTDKVKGTTIKGATVK